jgi:hypothetical protein
LKTKNHHQLENKEHQAKLEHQNVKRNPRKMKAIQNFKPANVSFEHKYESNI